MSVLSSPAYQYLLHYKLSIPKFLPAPVSPMSARSLQNNSSTFWNLLSPTASYASIRNSINNYRLQPWVHLSPVTADIYIEDFESLAIPTSPILIKWWFRYVDGVHSATRKDQVNKLQEHLNPTDPHIKFTIELPGTDGLPFLDTLTKSTPKSTEPIVHRKPTHTDRHLDYSSNHPILAKLSLIHTLIHRAKQVCSTSEFLAKEMDHLHQVLQDNHYPSQFFEQGKPQQKMDRKPNLPTGKFIEGARVLIQYIKGLSE